MNRKRGQGFVRFGVLAVMAGLVAGLVGGCGRSSALCEADLLKLEPLEGDAEALTTQAMGHWEKRAEEAELRAAIDKMEQALRVNPDQSGLYIQLARAYYFLGDGHLRFDEEREDDMLAAFERGILFAETGIRRQNAEFREMICDDADFKDAVLVVDKASVPLLYWYASNLGKWALAKGLLEALNQKEKIRAMMARCSELDPAYFYGGPNRYFGALYTKLPFPGGDPEKSRANFDASLEIEPNYFATRVLMAELLASKTGDRELFEESLRFVVDTAVDVIPELAPEQAIEQKKARLLLEDIDTLFE